MPSFIETNLLINALNGALSSIIDLPVEPIVSKAAKEFLQRSYKRKGAEAKLANAIEMTIDELAALHENEWLIDFLGEISKRPELAARIATLAIEMRAIDPNRIPDDLVQVTSPNESQRYLLAVFLYRLRLRLTQIEGYAEAIKYTDELYESGVLQNISQQINLLEGQGILESQVEVRSGPAVIVASGTVISYAGNPIEITYGPRIERLTLIFAFKDDKSNTRVEASTPNPNTLKLTLFNYVSPLGMGTSKPVNIGTLVGKPLYIQFRVYSFDDADKTIHYTIYQSEEAPHNE